MYLVIDLFIKENFNLVVHSYLKIVTMSYKEIVSYRENPKN